MDFESPDVEKEFPGLFASESVKKCNESDSAISDENHDKPYKKELIGGKKKDKRDSKKDRGYAALEGESSADENTDSKSPSKSKKSKSFKFPTKKSEKREKSREKEPKEKEPEKDKKKEKDKKEKDKMKLKDKKKSRHSEDLSECNGDYPVFGVDLETSVERSGCLDGVLIPLIVRNCIDCIHDYGLPLEGLYKTIGVKSKVLSLKRAYNLREPVSLKDCDVFVATCLLKTFVRELPEPLLTHDLLTRFEEAGAIMEVDAREAELQNLILQLPHHNRILLSWLIVHFDTVTLHEKQNKLNAQSIAMTFSPVLQMSHRLLTAFLCHCKTLFPDTVIEKYVPPLCAGSPLPEKSEEIVNELQKQESLLSQIHKEMSQGFVSKKREEQLWEVQRIVTQLKRPRSTISRSYLENRTTQLGSETISSYYTNPEMRLEISVNRDTLQRTLRSLQKAQETNPVQRSLDEDQSLYEEKGEESRKYIAEKEEPPKTVEEPVEMSPETRKTKITEPEKPNRVSCEDEVPTPNAPEQTLANSDAKAPQTHISPKWTNDSNTEILRLQLEREHLVKFQTSLVTQLEAERQLINRLNTEIRSFRIDKESPDEDKSPNNEEKITQLIEENNLLMKKKDDLVRRIFEEKLACLNLRVTISLLELIGKVHASP